MKTLNELQLATQSHIQASEFFRKYPELLEADGNTVYFRVPETPEEPIFLSYVQCSNKCLDFIKSLVGTAGWQRATMASGSTDWSGDFKVDEVKIRITLYCMEHLPTEVPPSAWPIMIEDTKD